MNVIVSVLDAPPLRNGFPSLVLDYPDLAAREAIDLDFVALQNSYPPVAGFVTDFLLIASVTYTIDKTVSRRLANDFWTRDLNVAIPVSDPGSWTIAAPSLRRALTFLTGDEWRFEFTQLPQISLRSRDSRKRMTPLKPSRTVSLFSGGADSLVGVLNHLSSSEDPLSLVGHRDALTTGGDQSRLLHLVIANQNYSPRLQFLGGRVRPLPMSAARPELQLRSVSREHTLRSRSLVFLAMGIYVAQQLGDRVPLLIPENGFIAINIPLTPSRIGSCSTRTTHPYYLAAIRSMLTELGIDQPIENPLAHLTKGETLTSCGNLEELRRLLPWTVSCAHPTRRGSWLRRHVRNCGYCVPCLVRRAAVHTFGADNGQDYGIDVFAGEIAIDSTLAADLRALLDCVDQVRDATVTSDRVASTGPLGYADQVLYTELVQRGLNEVRQLIADKADRPIQLAAGIV